MQRITSRLLDVKDIAPWWAGLQIPVGEDFAMPGRLSVRAWQDMIVRLVRMAMNQLCTVMLLKPLLGGLFIYIGIAFNPQRIFAKAALLAQLACQCQSLLQWLLQESLLPCWVAHLLAKLHVGRVGDTQGVAMAEQNALIGLSGCGGG